MNYHNQYPADWARLNREAVREAGKEGQIAFFSGSALREEELLKRRIEWSPFTPAFLIHEGLHPELRDFFARFAKTRQQLLPYLDFCMRQAAEKGYPMVRHLYLHYPADPNVLELDEQYLLGPDLLVAPVVRKKQTTVKAYLPEGQWKHFWSGEIYEGGKWYETPAPVGEPAAWWRVNEK